MENKFADYYRKLWIFMKWDYYTKLRKLKKLKKMKFN